MNEQKHAPEPWRFEVVDGNGRVFNGSDNSYEATITEAWNCEHNNEANARRIVACVNALVGVPQDVLDDGWTYAGVEAAAKMMREEVERKHAEVHRLRAFITRQAQIFQAFATQFRESDPDRSARHSATAARYREILQRPEPTAEQSSAVADVLAERRRQIDVEGWSAEHDKQHNCHELSGAAACYALCTYRPKRSWVDPLCLIPPKHWPDSWDAGWWKPDTPRRNLVKAAALIIADIERIDQR